MTDHSSPDDPLDLSALDPFHDGASVDARARTIAAEAMDARARLTTSAVTEGPSIVRALMFYSAPTMIAAALILAAALSTLARTAPRPSTIRQVSAADAMGIPRRLSDILHSSGTPSLIDLEVALDAASAR